MKNLIHVIVRLVIILVFGVLLAQNYGCHFISSCFPHADSIHQTVYLDSNFTPHEVELITEAANEWTKETHNVASYTIITNFDTSTYKHLKHNKYNLVVFKVSRYTDYIKSKDEGKDCCTLGYYDESNVGPFISIVWDRLMFATDDYYRGVVLHEFGHALGLAHREIENTIMHPHMNKSSLHLSPLDIEYFCEKYTCLKQN